MFGKRVGDVEDVGVQRSRPARRRAARRARSRSAGRPWCRRPSPRWRRGARLLGAASSVEGRPSAAQCVGPAPAASAGGRPRSLVGSAVRRGARPRPGGTAGRRSRRRAGRRRPPMNSQITLLTWAERIVKLVGARRAAVPRVSVTTRVTSWTPFSSVRRGEQRPSRRLRAPSVDGVRARRSSSRSSASASTATVTGWSRSLRDRGTGTGRSTLDSVTARGPSTRTCASRVSIQRRRRSSVDRAAIGPWCGRSRRAPPAPGRSTVPETRLLRVSRFWSVAPRRLSRSRGVEVGGGRARPRARRSGSAALSSARRRSRDRGGRLRRGRRVEPAAASRPAEERRRSGRRRSQSCGGHHDQRRVVAGEEAHRGLGEQPLPHRDRGAGGRRGRGRRRRRRRGRPRRRAPRCGAGAGAGSSANIACRRAAGASARVGAAMRLRGQVAARRGDRTGVG